MEFLEEAEAADVASQPGLMPVASAAAAPLPACDAPQVHESDHGDTTPAKQDRAAGDKLAAEPPAGRGFTAAWRDIVAAHKEVERINIQQTARSQDAFGVGLAVCDPVNLGSIRYKIMDKVVAQAARSLSCPGMELDIDASEVGAALGTKANHYPDALGRASYEEREQVLSRDFDPDAIWLWLQRKYEGGFGEKLGRQKAAKKLFIELNLRERPPVMEREQLLMKHHTWSDKLHRGRCYSLKSLATMGLLRQYLAAFASWAGDAETVFALRHLPPIDEEVCAHRKRTFGGIQWTFFSERVDIRISAALSTKFRQFIVEFGPRPGEDC